jgi:glutamyl-tRNA reductase
MIMEGTNSKDLLNFYAAGINYRKSDAGIRGQFAVTRDQYSEILVHAPSYGINEMFILSTCNRTEIYGFAEDSSQLINLLCSHTAGTAETFIKLAYVKRGHQAVQHLFNVAAGLDSQILGDYEIVGQIKQSFNFAKQHLFTGSFTERLINTVLQSSKLIRSETALSGGTVSVSFAAVQYIRQHIADFSSRKILLLGVGKIGRNTCKNLVDYLGNKNITLINRSEDKAAALAGELGLHYAPVQETGKHIHLSDIIIVATNAPQPTILKADLENSGNKLIIDLSVPSNVEPAAKVLANVTLIDVDQLSGIKDLTIRKREAEVPKAKAIIKTHIEEFIAWNDMRKHVSVLRAVKTKLQQINTCKLLYPLAGTSVTLAPDHNEKIQQVINVMAVKMRRQNRRGCHYIEAINEYIAIGATRAPWKK